MLWLYPRKISTRHFYCLSTKVPFPTVHHSGLKPAEFLLITDLRVSGWVFLVLRNLLASHSLLGLKHMLEQWCRGWIHVPSHHEQHQFLSPTQRTANAEGCKKTWFLHDIGALKGTLQHRSDETVQCFLSQDWIILNTRKINNPFSCAHLKFSFYHLCELLAFICPSCSQSSSSILVHHVPTVRKP